MSRRVDPSRLVALQAVPNHVRNICILAHVDHGKTTLSDLLVSSNGIISERQAGKLRYLDSTEDEQKRGITMRASAISLVYNKKKKRPRAVAAEEEEAGEDYLVNLIDSPGHIDFSSDVSTATRVSDGGLIVVDVVEGVCVQTNTVLRQAWTEGMKPCLILNKIDRLAVELRLDPMDAWHRLRRIVEKVNALSAALIANRSLEGLAEAHVERLESEWTFSPESGNVVFAAAIDGWGFRIGDFSRMWAQRLNAHPRKLREYLWGDYAFHAKDKKVVKYTASSKAQPMFVAFVLDPMWQVYTATVLEQNKKKTERISAKLNLEIPPRELSVIESDARAVARSVLRRWLPLADAVLSMVVDHVHSPEVAQPMREHGLWTEESIHFPPDMTHPHLEEIKSATHSVRESVRGCDRDGPLIAFISKMTTVHRNEIRTPQGAMWLTPNGEADDDDDDVLVAFTRVFSGTLRADCDDLPYCVLAPKHNPARTDFQHAFPLTEAARQLEVFTDRRQGGETEKPQPIALFVMMGDCLQPVREVPAGNLCAIAGLERSIMKCGTLSDSPFVPALRSLALQAKPMIRVAVEAQLGKDISKLEAGLRRLHQADPAVEISVQQSGEQVVAALGELHLEQCLKDLEQRYARVPLRVSAPLVSFREGLEYDDSCLESSLHTTALTHPSPTNTDQDLTVARQWLSKASSDGPQLSTPPWSTEEGIPYAFKCGGAARVPTADGLAAVTVILKPISKALADAIDQSSIVAQLPRKITLAEFAAVARGNGGDECLSLALEEHLSGGDDRAKDTVIALGPRSVGPNLLIQSSACEVRFHESKEKLVRHVHADELLRISTTQLKKHDQTESDDDDDDEKESSLNVVTCTEPGQVNQVWHTIQQAVMSGFQMASASGPLAEEPMFGVCVSVEAVDVVRVDDGCEAMEGGQMLSFQLTKAMRNATRVALLSSKHVRLVEGFFTCDLQCEQSQLGNLYAVLSKRRGVVSEEDIIEGTELFIIRAHLPVVESIGFASELLDKTSGAATAPQLAFSHWAPVLVDPFWRPTTEDEREEMGESHVTYEMDRESNLARRNIDAVRRRKGLMVEEKIVVAAEKQRTLTKMK